MANPTTPPTLDDLEAMASDVLASMPAVFRDRTAGAAFAILEFPDDDLCADMGIDSPFDLYGLYSGTPFGEKGLAETPNDLDRIFLYRRPILDLWCETGDDLESIVRHVLVHEIGHHLGLSDEDMERIEQQAADDAKTGPAPTPA